VEKKNQTNEDRNEKPQQIIKRMGGVVEGEKNHLLRPSELPLRKKDTAQKNGCKGGGEGKNTGVIYAYNEGPITHLGEK